MQELCRALEGSRHYSFLNAAACPPLLSPAAHTAPKAMPTGQPHLQGQLQRPESGTERLLGSWCTAVDKLATGWGPLSNAECMQRFTAVQRKAVEAVRQGGGMMLFKHVHKVTAQPRGECLPAV